MKQLINIFNLRRLAAIAPTLFVLLLSAGGVEISAQVEGASVQAQREQEARDGGGEGAAAGGLLRALNLTPEQRAQIAAIRRETVPQGRLLGARLRQARRALDEAIYSDNPHDASVEDRVREVSAAQAAIMRQRALTELRIRRVLSPAQLNAFRQLQRSGRLRQEQRRRMNQVSPPQGDLPGDEGARRFRENRQRRRLERQQQQQPLLKNQNPALPSAPREQRRTPARVARPPRP